MRRLPTTGSSPDWQRKVADAVNGLIGRTDWDTLGDFADDVAAAAGGVEIGSLYRTGSAVKVRIS